MKFIPAAVRCFFSAISYNPKKLTQTISGLAVLALMTTCATAQTVGYFADISGPSGGAGNNAGLNIGQSFTVTGTNIQIFSLGVYDYQGNGLNAAHTVRLFTNQTQLASVTVPAGTSATLLNSFRFAALGTPVTLPPGNYSVVAYQMNGNAPASDVYADQSGNNGFNGTLNIAHVQTIYEFTANTTAYPGTGGGGLGTSGNNLASASFTYSNPPPTIGYTIEPKIAHFGGAGNNSGLNIGHNFTVSGGGIKIFQLGVFDYQGDGLNASHAVTLFQKIGGTYTPVTGGSVTVPSGTAAPLGAGFRFAPLATPLKLLPGDYSVIAYQMNGNSGSDPYAENNFSSFTTGNNVVDAGFSPYEFTSSGSPAYPSSGANTLFGASSFTYTENHPPVAGAMTATRLAGETIKVALSDMATNWSDAESDAISLTQINFTTTNGVTLTQLNVTTNSNGSYVTNNYGFLGYTNNLNVADRFSYTIRDSFGSTNIGFVNIVVQTSVTGTNSITGIQSGVPTTVTAYGIPGYSYILERSTNLVNWVSVSTNVAAANGRINATDSFSDLGGQQPASANYRLKYQP